jgi:hypothetical protein
MKIKAHALILPLFCLYLITAINYFDSMKAVTAGIRVFRLAALPLTSFILFALMAKAKFVHIRHFLWIIFPVVVILVINLFQLISLPKAAIATHITGSIKFTSWFIIFFCTVFSLTPKTAKYYRNTLATLLVGIFLVGIAFYPSIILRTGGGVSSILSAYGQVGERFQSFGIFGSANEDANGLLTLFPLVLLAIEKISGKLKTAAKLLIFTILPIILLYNGTRTALLATLPLIAFLFYSNFSIKGLARLSLLASTAIGIASPILISFVERSFHTSDPDGGSFNWRLEHAWIPAFKYTTANSPLFGFGSRGWEYIGNAINIYQVSGTNPNQLEIIPAHSCFIWVYVSWGMIGFAAYLLLLAILLIEAFKLSQSRSWETRNFGKALFCSMVAYCLWAYISNAMWEQGWLILIGLAILIASSKLLELFRVASLRAAPSG